MKNFFITFFTFALLMPITSCQEDIENENQNIATEKIIVEKMKVEGVQSKASSNESIGLEDFYSIKYRNNFFENVPLTKEKVEALRAAYSVSDPIPVSLHGYSQWTVRTEGNNGGDWYALYISTGNTVAPACGIAPGTYIVRDVWLWQTYTFSTPMVVVIPGSYSSYAKMGWNPDTMSGPGYKHSLSGTELTLKTAATLFRYTVAGQEVYKTYPVNGDSIEWNFDYITIN